jgi:hypothetical protein
VQQTHAEWVAVRTAGTRNWLARNLPRIPCIGSTAYKCYRLAVNLCKIRLLRQAEHCYYHAVAHSLKSVQEAMNAFYQAFHQETFLLHEEISQLYDKFYDMEAEQSIDVAPLPDTCVLRSPLADCIRGVRQRSHDVTGIARPRNSDEELYLALGQRSQTPQEMRQRKQEERFSFIEKIPILQYGAKPLLVMESSLGEFLGLLRTHRIHAVGIDTNLLHIDRLSRVGYDVHQCEATDYLQRMKITAWQESQPFILSSTFRTTIWWKSSVSALKSSRLVALSYLKHSIPTVANLSTNALWKRHLCGQYSLFNWLSW